MQAQVDQRWSKAGLKRNKGRSKVQQRGTTGKTKEGDTRKQMRIMGTQMEDKVGPEGDYELSKGGQIRTQRRDPINIPTDTIYW